MYIHEMTQGSPNTIEKVPVWPQTIQFCAIFKTDWLIIYQKLLIFFTDYDILWLFCNTPSIATAVSIILQFDFKIEIFYPPFWW